MAYKFTPEHLYENTNHGLDIIFKYCPDAVGKERTKKSFKLRPDENTASANLVQKPECWVVKDFGDKGYNPIALCRLFTGLSFIEALKHLYAEFNIGETTNFFRAETTFEDTDKPLGWFEIIEADNYSHLDLVGRFVTEKIALEYDFISVKQYSFVVKNKKTDRNTLITNVATDHFPIFAYKFCDTWAKIYQPMDRKFKHSFVGKKPERHVFGLTRLKAIYQETIDNFDSDIKSIRKNKKLSDPEIEAEVNKIIDLRDDFKIGEVLICSGGSDGLGVASLGYNAMWFNSEGEQLSYAEYQELKKICHRIYNLPDIDAPGKKYAYKLAETFWNMPTIWLPESIKKHGGKDFRDWLKRYSQNDLSTIQYHFANIISGALRMRFFDVHLPAKRHAKPSYKLRFEFLCYFLNIKGFYTYKIEQKNLDNIAPELIIFIKIEGNIVTKVSPRVIRAYAKQFLREKGQPVEVLELIAMSTMFNENNLVGLAPIELDFKNNTPDSQFFFFQNNVAEIRPDKIEYIPHGKFKNFVWSQSVKNHNILPEKDFFSVAKNELGLPVVTIERTDCQYLNYLINTSRVFWRRELETQFGQNHTAREKYHDENRFNIAGKFLTDPEREIQNQHLANKLYALGYLMHRYKQDSFSKAVIVTDDKVKELEDEANGGSGKSVMFKGIDTLLPNRHWLDGKNKNFESDKHVLQGLTKDNDYVIIEDAHAYFDINFIYNWVTGSIVVNPKNAAPYEIHFDDAGKVVLTTNYGVRNYTASTKRRLLFVTTSDYYHAHTDQYNEERKVSDDFAGLDLFKNWDDATWNKHYNFLLQCCQLYLQNRGTEFKAPINNVEANNITASLGDTFISWADGYFFKDYHGDTDEEFIEGTLNRFILRKEMYKNYKEVAEKHAKNPTTFKKSLVDYCKMRHYIFNPKELLGSDGTIKKPALDTNNKRQVLEHFYIKSSDFVPVDETEEQPETTAPDLKQTEMTFQSNGELKTDVDF